VINVSANGATVDLGGFRIVGPAVCSGVPVTSCTSTGPGVGVLGASDVTVKNGAITGMGDDGVRLDYSGRVEGLHVFSNAGDGIVVGNESIVWRNIVTSNGGDGITCSDRCVVHDNTSTGNGERGASLGLRAAYGGNVFSQNGSGDVSGGHATRGNQCADRTCSSRGARRFYLTQSNTFTGAQALAACAPGFHMASMWEIKDTSALEYDVSRGQAEADSGFGPPTSTLFAGVGLGWVRTGVPAGGGGGIPGLDNCTAWSSTSGSGTAVSIGGGLPWDTAPASRIEPWLAANGPCSTALRVWCVED
jgi:hypothetical protein